MCAFYLLATDSSVCSSFLKGFDKHRKFLDVYLKILDSIFTSNFLLSQTLVCESWDKDMQSFSLF